MNDVKDICDQLLDVPAPAMRSSTDVIAAAVGAQRRRRVTVGATLAVLTAVALAVVNLPGVRAAAPSPASTPPHTPSQAATVRHASWRDTLINSLPAGYTVMDRGVTDVVTDNATGQLNSMGAFFDVWQGKQGGELMAYAYRGPASASTEDLCSVPADRRLIRGTSVGCRTIDVRGVAVRYAVEKRTSAGVGPRGELGVVDAPYVTRYVDGWTVIILQTPYVNAIPDVRVPLLTGPIFTPEEMAALIAQPAFIP